MGIGVLAGGLCLLGAAGPVALGQEAAQEAAGGVWLLSLRPAPERPAELEHLARLRRSGDRAEFARVAAECRERCFARQDPLVELLEARGVELRQRAWMADGLMVHGLTEELREELAGHPLVARIEPNRLHHPLLATATDALHHDSQGANQLQVGGVFLEGQGVTVAVLDSGLDVDMNGTGRPHAAFYVDGDPNDTTGGGLGGSRVLSAVGVESACGAPVGTTLPEDQFGHGTRVSAVLAGAAFNALPDVGDGPAPGASIRSYRITDTLQPSLASTCTMSRAFDLIAMEPDVLVANMSYEGSAVPNSFVNRAIDGAALSGILITLAAGNSGSSGSFHHAAFNVLSVGSSFVDRREPYAVPGFQTSAVGPLRDGRRYPQLIAVGEAVTTAVADDEGASIDSYGSSVAAALVAGTAALVRQADPSLSALETRALLLNTAHEVVLGDARARGFGYLASKAAVEAALAGEVSSGTARKRTIQAWDLPLAAGEEAVLTLAWNRSDVLASLVPDLDLRVLAPGGGTVDLSTSRVDNAEQVRFVAPVAGVYRAEVLPTVVEGSSVSFALAGVQGAGSSRNFLCVGNEPRIAAVEPGLVPQSDPFGPVLFSVKGCNLMRVTGVKVGGLDAVFAIQSDRSVLVELPSGVPSGNAAVDLEHDLGATTGVLRIGEDGPQLFVGTPNLWDGVPLYARLFGDPGAAWFLGASPDLGPTSIAGVLDLDIGVGGGSLVLLGSGFLDPMGQRSEFFAPPLLAPGTTLYLQGAVMNTQSGLLEPTNLQSSLYILHLF